MRMRSWLARLVHALTRKFTPRKTRCRFRWGTLDRLHALRLRLEALEDRAVPATFTVLNVNDTGAGSLRDAVAQANANGTADTIVFGDGSGGGGTNFLDATPDIILLTSGAITFAGDTNLTTVVGGGASLLTVSGGDTQAIWWVNSGISASISGMTITEGSASDGGGVHNEGTLSLSNCVITDNAATNVGGGLFNEVNATATLTDCTVSDNTAAVQGGGLNNFGTLTLTGCTVSGNTAATTSTGNGGGGLWCQFAGSPTSTTLINTTITGNVGKAGGGVLSYLASVSLTNCTVSGNTAGSGGGLQSGGTVTVANTVVAGNTAVTSGPDVQNPFSSLGNNLIGKTDGSSGWVASDLTGTIASPLNPQLGALASNGGPTQTMALLPISPAINAGNVANAPAADQRGQTRFGGTDIGAFEYQFKVVNVANSGVGSLRQAVANANTAGTADTIVFTSLFNAPQIINLTSGQLTLSDAATTTISGPGANLLTVSGKNLSRVFNIGAGASAAISGLTITEGTTGSFGGGGLANSGTVTLTDAVVSGNTAVNGFWGGGGVFNYASGTATLTNVTVSSNTAPSSFLGGGGLFNLGSLTLINSTISGNSSPGRSGGGLGNNYNGNATLINCTVSGNTGTGVGSDGGNAGGVGMAMTLINCTISGNTGGVSGVRGGTTTFTNSIVAGNGTDTGFSINATFSSLGNNLIGNRGTTTGWLASDLTGTAASPIDPQLGPLANNGGPTQTMSLLAGSPAINAGNAANAPATDQRGQTRLGNTDIGASEYSFKVTTTADSGAGSLRQAMLNANATAGTDTVLFFIPGAGVHTIAPLSALPTVTETIGIDGTRQPGYAASPLIQIDGTSVGSASGLTLAAGSSGSTVKGLILSNFSSAGAAGITVASNNNVIQGNWIGTTANGTGAAANTRGISITGTGNLIGGTAAGAGNTVAFNTDGGVVIDGAAGNTLRLNRVFANTNGQIRLLNGANQAQPAPILSAVLGGNSTRVFGALTSVAPNTSFAIDLFSSPTLGEARTVLGTATVTSNALGTAAFDITVAGTAAFGDQVTATATRLDIGNTSALAGDSPVEGAIIAGVPLTLAEGTPVTLTAFTAADPGGGQALAYNWTVTKNGSPYATSAEASITFTPDNQGTYVVTLRVTSSTGANAVVGPVTLNATNAPPAPQIFGAPSEAAAGAAIQLTAAGNDPGTADAVSYAWQVRDTSATGPLLFSGSGPSFAFTPTTGGLYHVALTADDHDGGVATTSQAIIVRGGPALATIDAPAIADEGTPVRALAAVSTLIRTDSLDYQWSVLKAGVPYPFTRLDKGGITFTPNDNAFYTVGLTVVSGGVAFPASPAVVDVRNVNPEATIVGAPATAPAGVPLTVSGVATDRGTADTETYRWTVVGPAAVPGGTGSQFTFTPPAAGDYVLQLTVRDDDGGSTTVARAVHVTATGLTVGITGAPASSPEGTLINLDSTIANPNGATFRYDWSVTRNGDPFRTLSSVTPANPTGFTTTPLPLPLLPTDNGNYVATLTVVANDGRVGATTVAIPVVNVAPTAAITGGTGTIFEGDAVALTAVVADPGTADTQRYEWRVNGVVQPADATDPRRFTFTPADNGTYTVSLTVTDKDGGVGTTSRVFTVLNVAPAAQISSDPTATAADGSVVGLASVVTDPGTADTFTYAWTVTGGTAVGPTHAAPLRYAPAPGAVTVMLTVTDDDGGTVTRTVRSIVGTAGPDAITITAPGTGVDAVLVQGLGGNDTITTAPAVTIPVVLDGGAGNDLLQGGGGADVLIAGPGNNTLGGGAGDDVLHGGGSDNMSGGVGSDYYFVHFSTVQLYETGSGTDTIDLTGAQQGVTFNLSIQDGTAQTVFAGSTLAVTGPFETVVGSNFGDKLTTASSGTTLFGGLGDDSLAVAGGINVTVFGGDGNDSLTVGAGTQVTVFGGTGDDLLAVTAGTQVTVFGDDGNDSIAVGAGTQVTVFGGTGDDSLAVGGGTQITVFGGEGQDDITLTGGSEVAVVGGSGQSVGSFVTLFGSAGGDDDTLSVGGTATQVTVFGGDGEDSLAVGGGTQITVFGGAGDDSLAVTAGTQVTVFGDDGNDSLVVGGTATQVTVFGGLGDDSIAVAAGTQVTVFGSDGNDSLAVGGGTQVTVFGGDGNDSLSVGAGTQVTIFGDAGNDSLSVTGGTQVTVFGGTGDDSLAVGAGTQVTVFGGDGNDTLAVGAGTQITVFGGAGDDSLAVTGGTQVTVFGDDGNDSLTVGGTSTQVTVFGGTGDDSLAVTGGTQVTVFGDDGNDSLSVGGGTQVTVFGGDGNDSIAVGAGTQVTIFGGTGDDSLAVTGGTQVTVFGGDGNDSLSVGAGTQITVFGGTGDDSLAVTAGTQVTVFGDSGNDSLTVTGGTQVTVFGADGNDSIAVGGGTQVTVFGGDGNDSLSVGAGTQITVFGGTGDDSLAVSGGTQVTVFGGDGNDSLAVTGGTQITVFGGTGDDSLSVGAGTQVTVFGGDGNDSLSVGAGTQVTVFGGTGDDSLAVAGGTQVTVFGNEGNDSIAISGGTQVTVFGNDGNDSLAVGGGAQITVFGGTGDDSLSVAAGTQVTVFGDAGNDSISVAGGTQVTVFGADGNDSLTAGGTSTQVTVFGGRGDDTLAVTGGTSVKLYGETGNDVLAAAGGANVTVAGGSGNDTLTASGGTGVVLLGGTGADLLTAAGTGDVILSGGAGDDTLAANQAGGAYLFGDDGNDAYRFAASGAGAVKVKEILVLDVTNFEAAGATADDPAKDADAQTRGTDTLDLSAFSAAAVNLSVFGSEANSQTGAQAVAAGFTLTIFGTFENVIGTAGNDVLVGNAAANELDGGGGNDSIDGQGGDDTITGGTGNDTLTGGGGSDTYVFAGGNLGVDTLTEAVNVDSDSLDFAQFAAAVTLNLGSITAQAFGPNLTLTLSSAAGIENVVGTAFSDAITGNARDNMLAGGAGDDTLAGAAGSDTYVFTGTGLGADRVVEAANADSDTLDFAGFDGPLTLDLAGTATQSLGAAGQSLTLTDGAGVENVVGTVYADTIRGNARDNALFGGGGADFLDGRAGNDNLQGDFTQVVLLDFDSATDASSGDHVYTATERTQIIARLQAVFAPFNYVFTTDPTLAAALTARSGRGFNTLVFNDGAGGGIGGEANELDFGNRVHGDRGTVDVNTLLGGGGQPAATSANFVGLSATIAAHELGHMAGLLHADALGPVGTGIYAGLDPTRFLPAFTGPAGATETPRHIMASPLSLGTTLFDAAGTTYFGEREAVKLAFAETGVVRAEQAAAPGSHATFATAEALGVLPGLSVPNTLQPGDRDYGKAFDVSALAVVGNIQLAGSRSEDDVYSFTGKTGDVMTFSILSGVLNPPRGNPIDGLLKLYGANGQLLAVNDDSPESTDPLLLDVTLPADGVYYVVVDTYAAAQDVDVGRYELFLYRFAATSGTAAVNLGDTIIGGAGSDTVVGSTADDTFRATGATSGDVDTYLGKVGFDSLDLTGFPLLQYTATGVELVTGQNQAPTLAPIDAVVVPQGATATIVANATDPDALDRLTFTLTATGQSGDVFPAGASVDVRTGVVTWVAGHPGSYAALLTVTDAAGVATSQRIVIQVTNAAPVISAGGDATLNEGGSLARTGSFADPGADAWTATVDYGNGSGVQSLALNPDRTFALAHSYANSGSYVVTVVVHDGFVASAPTSFTVTAANVAPTATLSSSGAVAEGGTATVAFANPFDPSPADVAAGFRYSFALAAGDLAGSYAAASTTSSASFAFPADGTYTVHGRVFDQDGGFTDHATTVVVTNVAPTASSSTDSQTVTAGTAVSLTSTTTDAGNDVSESGKTWTVVSSNGQPVADGSGTAFAFTPTDSGTYTILFKATDANGAVSVATLEITALAAPTGVLSNSGPVAEGGTATVTLTPTNVSAAVAATLRYAFDFNNDGTFDLGTGTYAGSVSANAAVVPASYLADGPFNRVVRARVIDATGAYTDLTTSIAVVNATPVVTAGGAVQLTESAASLARTESFADTGADSWTATVDYGDGAGFQPLTLNADRTFSLAHTYTDGGNYTVTVRVTDDDGAVGTASFAVTVANVAPTATIGNGGAVAEGGTGTVSLANPSDPSAADTAAEFRYSFDFDSDGVFEVVNGTSPSATVPASFLADGPLGRVVTGRILDKDGGFTDYTTTIAVNNVAPAVSAGGNASLPYNGALSRTGSFTDPGADTWTAQVNYGDGGGWVPLALNADKTFALSHTYLAGGEFTVSVQVADDDLGTDTKTFTVTVVAAPTAAVTSPTSGVRGQVRTFTFSATDSAADLTAGFVYTITWGDGSPTQTIARTAGNGAGVNVDHVFPADGTFTVSVTATDQGGNVSPAATGVITVHVAQLQTEGSVTTLAVGGTTGGERIRVRLKEGNADYFVVSINTTDIHEARWRNQYDPSLVDRIAVFGQAGDDRLRIDADILIPAELFGGDGNDTLEGGSGADVIVGGAGDDRIRGGDGRDVLIGGAGADRLWGEDNDDIMIAAYTVYDTNQAALRALLAEWASNNSYATRVNNLRAGGGLNGAYVLNDAAVLDDGVQDTLSGQNGQDWFLANLTGPTATRDTITDQDQSEWFTDT